MRAHCFALLSIRVCHMLVCIVSLVLGQRAVDFGHGGVSGRWNQLILHAFAGLVCMVH